MHCFYWTDENLMEHRDELTAVLLKKGWISSEVLPPTNVSPGLFHFKYVNESWGFGLFSCSWELIFMSHILYDMIICTDFPVFKGNCILGFEFL